MPAYATDTTDEQWLLIANLIPRPKTGGRRRTTDARRVVDGILYLLKTGCQWRQLPNDFPPWRTVYGYFDEWGKIGVWKKIQRALYFMVRKAAGRSRLPSIVVIDSQSVKTGKMGGERGYDGGKRVKGRKRHFAVDSLGLPLAISVTAANVHDLTGARKVLPQVRKFLLRRSFRKIYADGAYIAQTFKDWAKEKFDAVVRISKNLAMQFKRFIPVSQRWVVERTFAWLQDFRRLTLDYERTTRHSRFMLRMAAISLMLNRLAPNELAPDW